MDSDDVQEVVEAHNRELTNNRLIEKQEKDIEKLESQLNPKIEGQLGFPSRLPSNHDRGFVGGVEFGVQPSFHQRATEYRYECTLNLPRIQVLTLVWWRVAC
ncbi:hypothetical protein TNCV_543261 [Trichonephila clavipes]|nr:hypothetical protein TNCV_543261 [Trichonephila clavipes]